MVIERNVFVLASSIVATAAGLLDAIAGRNWDLGAVFALAGVLQAIVLSGLWRERRSLPLRPDLAGWVRARAAATGEPAERLANRAMAAYRAGMSSDDGNLP